MMITEISNTHKKRFEEIRKSISLIGSKEGNFIKIELLFYDAIAIAREYGDNVADNKLLAALKQLQANQYATLNTYFKKSSQKEREIRRFMNSLRNILSAGTKNSFFTSSYLAENNYT